MKIWRPYTQEMTANPALLVQSARGAFLHLKSGRKIFDGISSWWLITHGHGHPRIQEAIHNQLQSLHQVVFANFTYEVAEQFADLMKHFLPDALNRMFFSDNGSTAVEVSMKMAYQHAQFAKRKASSSGKAPNKFLAFESSYHGDTCGAMSLSQSGPFTKNYSGLLFEVIRCRQGKISSDSLSAWTSDCLKKMDEFEDQICAIILEPLIQGAGGMIVWPKEAVQIICQAAKEKGILVIFDEVMTGFGRTGTLFAFEQINFIPDFLCLSKGLTAGFLPMGLTITRSEIFDSFLDTDPQRMLFHGHSFTGNALSCAAALANLQVWKDENPLSKIKTISETHSESLKRLSSQIPIGHVRLCGSIAAFDLDLESHNSKNYGGSFSQKIQSRCLEQGVFIRPLGSTLYLMPPYCSTPADIENAWKTIGDVVFTLMSESLSLDL